MTRPWILLALAGTAACLSDNDRDGDGFTEDVDCDDTRDYIFPQNPETCDGFDNDCSGAVDDTPSCEAVYGPTWQLTFVSATASPTDAGGDAWDDDAFDANLEAPDLVARLDGSGLASSCGTKEVSDSLTATWNEACTFTLVLEDTLEIELRDIDVVGSQSVDSWSFTTPEELIGLLFTPSGIERELVGGFSTLQLLVEQE